ncbi:MAG: peptide deformylase [Armatimonadota bacterium]
MAVLKIAKYDRDEEILRARCKPVTRFDPKLKRLIDDMIDTMYDAAGVGLAAPQVFVNGRLFVYDVGEGPDALINPEVLQAEGEELGVEGCLSIPRLQGDVPRSTLLVVTGLNRRGKRVRIEARDYLARVFQHEIDHLNGILFPDRAVEKSLHWISEDEEAERRSEGRRSRTEAPAEHR